MTIQPYQETISIPNAVGGVYSLKPTGQFFLISPVRSTLGKHQMALLLGESSCSALMWRRDEDGGGWQVAYGCKNMLHFKVAI